MTVVECKILRVKKYPNPRSVVPYDKTKMVRVLGPYTSQDLHTRGLLPRLRHLTNRGAVGSGMYDWTFYEDCGDTRPLYYYLAWHQGKVIGWALVIPDVDSNYRILRTATLHVFVHSKFRRHGIGKRLVHRASASSNFKMRHHAWSEAGDRLFENL